MERCFRVVGVSVEGIDKNMSKREEGELSDMFKHYNS